MDDFTPFLQIVHISDLHITDPRSASSVGLRGTLRKLKVGFPWPEVIEHIEDGIAPHEPDAVSKFKEFLKRITDRHSGWAHCETWLVDTGDLTSLGDQDSFIMGSQFLSELKKHCTRSASIYGNHDAWPGTFPVFARKADIDTQKQSLAVLKYDVDKPSLALRTSIPGTSSEVQLYLVDSVIHQRLRNLRAIGEVSPAQLQALKQLVDDNYEAGKNHFRILGVHHPVHYPPTRPSFSMCMENDHAVAKALGSRTAKGTSPLAHLVLSGHTHSLYPQHGALPANPQLCTHPHLGTNQCQFVVGTLMQFDRQNKRGKYPHQCEVLRFYSSQSHPTVLAVERFFAARQATNQSGSGFGPYNFVEENGRMEEEITFTL